MDNEKLEKLRETVKEAEQTVSFLDRIENVSRSLRKLSMRVPLGVAFALPAVMMSGQFSLTKFFGVCATSAALTGYTVYVSRKKRAEIKESIKNFQMDLKSDMRDVMQEFRNNLLPHVDTIENLIDKSDFDIQDPRKARSVVLNAFSLFIMPTFTPTLHFASVSMREFGNNLMTERVIKDTKRKLNKAINTLKPALKNG